MRTTSQPQAFNNQTTDGSLIIPTMPLLRAVCPKQGCKQSSHMGVPHVHAAPLLQSPAVLPPILHPMHVDKHSTNTSAGKSCTPKAPYQHTHGSYLGNVALQDRSLAEQPDGVSISFHIPKAQRMCLMLLFLAIVNLPGALAAGASLRHGKQLALAELAALEKVFNATGGGQAWYNSAGRGNTPSGPTATGPCSGNSWFGICNWTDYGSLEQTIPACSAPDSRGSRHLQVPR